MFNVHSLVLVLTMKVLKSTLVINHLITRTLTSILNQLRFFEQFFPKSVLILLMPISPIPPKSQASVTVCKSFDTTVISERNRVCVNRAPQNSSHTHSRLKSGNHFRVSSATVRWALRTDPKSSKFQNHTIKKRSQRQRACEPNPISARAPHT